jgi:manganese/zinc/iron transport system substrate-binding protein
VAVLSVKEILVVRTVTLWSLMAVLMTLLAAGCKDRSAPGATNHASATAKLRVLATTGMIGDIARSIARDRAEVTWLMGEGVDPHLYKASPGDVRAMSDADMILYNGLHLEGRMADVITKMAAKKTVVQVTDTINESLLRQPPEFEGHFDPHVWFDVSLWSIAAERVRDALIAKDPQNKDAYTANATTYLAALAGLHDYAKSTIATIPVDKRIVVTAHDAFGYMGRAYDLKVLAIQGISTDSEASLQDINSLVDTLVQGKIPAVFIESSVSRKTIDALVEGCKSKGHNVVVGGELFSDAMGKTGTPESTYIGMVVHNVDTITRALGGNVPDAKPMPTPYRVTPTPAEKR